MVFEAEISLAQSLIETNGKQVTIRSFSDAVEPDPSKPWEPGSRSNADNIVDAVLLGFEERYVDGEVVQRGDKRALVAGAELSAPPKAEDLLIDGTTQWRIVNVETVSPNGELILYKLQLRR